MMEDEKEIQGKGPQCDSCHIGIGEGYMEQHLNRVGKSEVMICDRCIKKLNELGHLQITDLTQLLPDGRIIIYHGPLTYGEGKPTGRPPTPGGAKGEKKKQDTTYVCNFARTPAEY